MRILRSFLRLSRGQRRALLRATGLVSIVRVALRVLPFERLRRMLSRFAHAPPDVSPATQPEIDTIVWSLSAAGRTLPDAGRCLIEALAGHVLLARRGVPTDLRIGVARDPDGTFKAHAWLERGDRVVVGQLGAELQRYTPFPAMRGLEP